MAGTEHVPPRNQWLRTAAIYAIVAVVAFGLGFIPMWLTARTRTDERDAARQALRLTELENTLGAAAILSRRGDYEPAREAASVFYTNLQAELDRPNSGVTVATRDELQTLLTERDQIITLLARSDSAVAERLTTAYISYRQAVGTMPRQASPDDGP